LRTDALSPARKTAILGALLALSLALSVAESMLGALVPVPVPGVKLGLANIVSMFLLCYFSLPAALTLAALRTLLASLFTGGLPMFLYSAPGALLSTLVMYAALRFIRPLTIVGVSMLGAAVHNVAQVCAAVATTGETRLFYYAFILIAVGAVSGAVTGVVARFSFSRASAALHMRPAVRADYLTGGGI
jgi:heptaprenyl diphosphate synthase